MKVLPSVMVLALIVSSSRQIPAQDDPACDAQYGEMLKKSEYEVSGDGSIKTNHGDVYRPEDFYELEGTLVVCTCRRLTCVRKCCRQEEMYLNKTCTRVDEKLPEMRFSEGPPMSSFRLVYGKPCTTPNTSLFLIDPLLPADLGRYFVDQNGVVSLLSGQRFKFYDYCFDFIDDRNVLKVLVCLNKTAAPVSASTWIYVIGMVISMPFLLATFIVYSLLPVRNIYSKCLMCYVITLLVAYITLTTVQLSPPLIHNDVVCVIFGILCYFCFMVSFFTMNVMAFDVWWTFSTMRVSSETNAQSEQQKFRRYSLYIWGGPLLLVALVMTLTETVDKAAWYNPDFGNGRCWFRDDLTILTFFHSTIAIITFVNLAFFASTALRIRRIRKDTAMLKTVADSKKHERNKRRFNLYLKLLLAMGVNWIIEVVSWSINWKVGHVPKAVWYLADMCNAMYGVFIFFIFVFKKKIWAQLKSRYDKNRRNRIAPRAAMDNGREPRETTPNRPSETPSTSVTKL